VDPLQYKYPHYTPFQYAGNKPISFIDLDGLEPWPVKAEIGEYTRVITSGMYRNQGGKMHGAVDIAFKIDRKGKNVKVDAEVVATHSGIIEIHKNRGKAGNYITITNGDIRTRYLHLQKDDQGGTFKNGDFVNQGEKIGLLGMSGTDNPHLHYEIQVKKDGNWGKINPVIGDPDKVSAKDKFELKDPQKMIYGDSIKNDTDFGIDYFIKNTTIGPKETKLSDRLLETHIPVIKSFGDLLKLIKL
jgi:murein DD-endopeptidase MepM/ murein hydrolase activator NlpD